MIDFSQTTDLCTLPPAPLILGANATDPRRCMTAGRWANVPAGDVLLCWIFGLSPHPPVPQLPHSLQYFLPLT